MKNITLNIVFLLSLIFSLNCFMFFGLHAERSISSQCLETLKPFFEKQNLEMRAINDPETAKSIKREYFGTPAWEAIKKGCYRESTNLTQSSCSHCDKLCTENCVCFFTWCYYNCPC